MTRMVGGTAEHVSNGEQENVMRRKRIVILCLLTLPILIHECYHAAVDPRSPIHFMNWMMTWATPIFEDNNLVAGHVLVNMATLSFVGLSLFWIVRKQ